MSPSIDVPGKNSHSDSEWDSSDGTRDNTRRKFRQAGGVDGRCGGGGCKSSDGTRTRNFSGINRALSRTALTFFQ